MRILKRGDREKQVRHRRIFKCAICGCEFEAIDGEYGVFYNSYSLEPAGFSAYCPECSGLAFEMKGEDIQR